MSDGRRRERERETSGQGLEEVDIKRKDNVRSARFEFQPPLPSIHHHPPFLFFSVSGEALGVRLVPQKYFKLVVLKEPFVVFSSSRARSAPSFEPQLATMCVSLFVSSLSLLRLTLLPFIPTGPRLLSLQASSPRSLSSSLLLLLLLTSTTTGSSNDDRIALDFEPKSDSISQEDRLPLPSLDLLLLLRRLKRRRNQERERQREEQDSREDFLRSA